MKGLQGLASMPPKKRREIASLGGKKAHELGTAHRFTSEEGKQAVEKREHKKKEIL